MGGGGIRKGHDESFPQTWPPRENQMLVGEEESEIPADGFIFTAKRDILNYFEFRLTSPRYPPSKIRRIGLQRYTYTRR